jgi:hypothetical protein
MKRASKIISHLSSRFRTIDPDLELDFHLKKKNLKKKLEIGSFWPFHESEIGSGSGSGTF